MAVGKFPYFSVSILCASFHMLKCFAYRTAQEPHQCWLAAVNLNTYMLCSTDFVANRTAAVHCEWGKIVFNFKTTCHVFFFVIQQPPTLPADKCSPLLVDFVSQWSVYGVACVCVCSVLVLRYSCFRLSYLLTACRKTISHVRPWKAYL